MQARVARGASTEHLLIQSITPGDSQAIEVGTVTVLVGPNNAGKTESLRDLVRLAGNVEPTGETRESHQEPQTKVVHDVAFVSKLTVDRLLRGLTTFDDSASSQRAVQGLGPDLKTPCRRTVAAEIKNILYRPVLTARSVSMTSLGELMPLRVAYLAPGTRGELLAPAMACSPVQAPENLLQALRYAEPAVHEELDAAFHSAFPGLHVRLDATEHINLYLRLAAEFPDPAGDPMQAVRQYAALRRADQEGDGCRNYLAVLLAMLLAQGRVIVLDQPETCLHPEQARRLGRWIAGNAARLGCQVFLATHSVSMLEGLLEGNTDVNVLRLTRDGDTTSFQAVPAEIANALAQFPLLASQQALNCLFHAGTVAVAEIDSGVIYETVARRFLEAANIRFLHTHGSRNLGWVAKILRQAGIPTCITAQLDILQTETGFSELIKAVTGEEPPPPWLATRERLAKQVEGLFDARKLSASAHEVESFLDQFKKKGIAAPPATQRIAPPPTDPRQMWSRLQREQLGRLPQELRVWVEELIDDLKQRGVFVSLKGGFQGWIPADSPEGDRDTGFSKAIELLHRGECPPDLRAFVSDVLAHLRALAMPQRAPRARLNV